MRKNNNIYKLKKILVLLKNIDLMLVNLIKHEEFQSELEAKMHNK